MFTRFTLRLSLVAATAVAALPVAAGAQAANVTAAVPGGPSPIDPSTTFYACYVPNSGTVYRIKAANTPGACTKSTHVEFSWSARALAQVSIVTSSAHVPVGEWGSAVASCPVGTTLLSGGHHLGLNAAVGLPIVGASRPHPTDSNAWLVTVGNFQPGAMAVSVDVVAMCAQ